jgi:hypothetical protein
MKKSSCLRLSLAIAAAAVMFGCSSSSSKSTSTSTETSTSTSSTTGTTFEDFYEGVIITYKCQNCHVPGKIGVSTTNDAGVPVKGGELDMSTPEATYMNLVNVKAAGYNSGVAACVGKDFVRVKPNDPAASLIVLKTELAVSKKYFDSGAVEPPCGAEMPLGCGMTAGLSCLGRMDITTLVDWINNGAPAPVGTP